MSSWIFAIDPIGDFRVVPQKRFSDFYFSNGSLHQDDPLHAGHINLASIGVVIVDRKPVALYNIEFNRYKVDESSRRIVPASGHKGERWEPTSAERRSLIRAVEKKAKRSFPSIQWGRVSDEFVEFLEPNLLAAPMAIIDMVRSDVHLHASCVCNPYGDLLQGEGIYEYLCSHCRQRYLLVPDLQLIPVPTRSVPPKEGLKLVPLSRGGPSTTK